MAETTVELDEAQEAGLRRLSAQTGQSEGDLIREAIDRLLGREDRLTMLQRSFGAWADNDEVENIMADSRRSRRSGLSDCSAGGTAVRTSCATCH